jgi:hypothetical protein
MRGYIYTNNDIEASRVSIQFRQVIIVQSTKHN